MKLNKILNISRVFLTNVVAVCCKKFYHLRHLIEYSKSYLFLEKKVLVFYWRVELKLSVLATYIYYRVAAASYRKLLIGVPVLMLLLLSTPLIYNKLVLDVEAQSSSLPNCDDLPVGTAADPMNGNCIYKGLPLCSDPSVTSPVHRVNCYDVADLPVCEYIENVNDRRPMRNCTRLCSNTYFSSSIQPVFNRNCTRMCDDLPAGMSANSGTCKQRLCHQTADSTQQVPGCVKERCDRLWPEEHEALFDAGLSYCDATNLKCFDLPQDLLPYVAILNPDGTFNNNVICGIHKCPPGAGTDSCDRPDEYGDLFVNKTQSYLFDYNRNVTNIMTMNNGVGVPFTVSDPRRFASCEPLDLCPPSTIRREHHFCNAANGAFAGSPAERIRRHEECDQNSGSAPSSGLGPDPECMRSDSGHQLGSCYKTIDCAIIEDNPLCVTGSPETDPRNIAVPEDPYESAFYRPTPSSKSVSAAGSARRIRGSAGTNWDDGYIDPTNLCYPDWGAINRADGGTFFTIPLLFTSIDVFGFSLMNSSISPGLCGLGDGTNTRGTGYIYLKGSAGLLYHEVDDDVIYQKGLVHTTFDNDVATHHATFCLRFRNALCTQCEGQRECAPTMSNMTPSATWSQICGRDLCRTFEIKTDPVDNLDGKDCNIEDGDPMDDDGQGLCSSEIDTYLRTRAVYYDSVDENNGVQGRVCGYLDVKGHVAHDNYIDRDDGQRNIGDIVGTCQNDTNPLKRHPNCRGFDSGALPFSAIEWRNIKKAEYVGNNQIPGSGNLPGYYDANGEHFKQEFCAKVKKRVGPTMLHNIADINNSPQLFNPPLLVRSANLRYFGAIDVETDFHQPEVMVQYGVRPIVNFTDNDPPPTDSCYNSSDVVACPRANRFTGYNQVYLSLDVGEISGRSKNAAGVTVLERGGISTESPATSRIYSEIPGVENRISTEVFAEKGFDSISGDPTFCVYERGVDGSGSVSENPSKVGCVKRRKPQFGLMLRIEDSGTTYVHDDRIGLRLNAASMDSSYTITSAPTNEALYDVISDNREKCSMDIENYRFCMTREPCTHLSRNCVRAAQILSRISGNINIEAQDYLAVIEECENEVLPTCLENRGLDAGGDMFDILSTHEYGAFRCINNENRYLLDTTNSNAANPDSIESCVAGDENPFLYGWFNQIEITKGAENMRNYVIAHKIPDGRSGMCKIDPSSPNLVDTVTDGNGNNIPNYDTNCLSGGDGRECLCIEVPSDFIVSDSNKYYRRLQTPREASLFIGFSIPNICNSFVGEDQSSTAMVFGENFPITASGNRGIGTCDIENGWTYEITGGGRYVYPMMQCIDDSNPSNPHEGMWDVSTLEHRCVRQTCNRMIAGNPNSQGNYFGFYDALEDGQCKGARNGFANWPRYLPDSTLDPSQYIVRADSCITGYRPMKSTTDLDINGAITGYSGGELPQRICQINGNYGPLTPNSVDILDTSCPTTEVLAATTSGIYSPTLARCEKILCNAINPAIPISSTDISTWNEWFNSGGATFSSVEASRHTSEIRGDSIATGVCNRDLGFFPIAGGSAPTRSCDYLGNWEAVQNPCSTLTCDAINEPDAINSNHGFAIWPEVTDASMTGAVTSGNNAIEVAALSCATGYVQNPYPPARDTLGNDLPDSSDLTRPAQLPKRYCIGGSDSAGNIYKIWRLPSNSCINKCPGSDVDDRIGIGVTSHATSSGTIEVDWPSTNFGEVQYISNWTGNEEDLNASHFTNQTLLAGGTMTRGGVPYYRRDNGLYLLQRRCGNNGEWEDPISSCALNGGSYGSATFVRSGNLGYENSLPAHAGLASGGQGSSAGLVTSSGICSVSEIIEPVRRNAVLLLIGTLNNTVPQIYCENSTSGFIDDTYLVRLLSTSDCGSCRPVVRRSLAIGVPSDRPNISADSQNRRYYPGEILSGNRFRCYRHHTYMPPTAAAAHSLDATCDPQGRGDWIPRNTRYCRASCRINPSMLVSQDVGTADGCGDGGANYVIRSPDLSSSGEMYIRDKEIFEFTAYKSCNTGGSGGNSPRCSSWRYSFKCNNGNIILNQNTTTGGPSSQTGVTVGSCPYSRYNYRRSSWGSVTMQAMSQNNYFVAYRHLPRPPANATGMGMVKEDGVLSSFYVECTNCTSGVRQRGVAPNANLGLYYWNNFVAVNAAMYPDIGTTRLNPMYPDIGITRLNPQCSQYAYSGSRDIVNFNTLETNQSGDEFIGSCGPNSTLNGLAPKVTCQADGSWFLENENNCKRMYSTGAQGSPLFTTPPSNCPNRRSISLRLPSGVTMNHGQEGGFILNYACGDFPVNTQVSYKAMLSVNDGALDKTFDRIGIRRGRRGSIAKEYRSNIDQWSNRNVYLMALSADSLGIHMIRPFGSSSRVFPKIYQDRSRFRALFIHFRSNSDSLLTRRQVRILYYPPGRSLFNNSLRYVNPPVSPGYNLIP